MPRLIARIRILPADADSDIDHVLDLLKSKIPSGMELKAHSIEPIAFGLQAIIGDFLLEDEAGQIDMLEESIRNTEGAGQIEVISISRQSVKIK